MRATISTNPPTAGPGGRFRFGGFSLIEVLVGSVLALAGVGVYIGLQVFQAKQDKDVDSRLAALCEARAVLESQLAVPYEELHGTPSPLLVPAAAPSASPPAIPGLAASPARSAFRELPGAELSCHVHPYANSYPTGRRALEIDVEARWQEDGAPRSLTLVSVRTDAWPLGGP